VIGTLQRRLLEEMVLVLLVFLAFLLHVRSGVVLLVTLPLACWGLRGHARQDFRRMPCPRRDRVAIGTMIDAAIVMVENVHRRLAEHGNPRHARRVDRPCVRGGRTVVVRIAVDRRPVFVPCWFLKDRKAGCSRPRVYEDYAMVVAALLSITVVPVLISLLVRGRVRSGDESVVNRLLARAYRPP